MVLETLTPSSHVALYAFGCARQKRHSTIAPPCSWLAAMVASRRRHSKAGVGTDGSLLPQPDRDIAAGTLPIGARRRMSSTNAAAV